MNSENKNEIKKTNNITCAQHRDNPINKESIRDENINCKLCNSIIRKSEYSNHLQQINHTEHMLNLIEAQSKQISILTQKLNDIVENEKVYENKWIISNFINKTNNEINIESPYIELYPYSFYILASKNSNSNLLNFQLQPSVAIKNEYTNKISLLFSLVLLNSKSSNNNIYKNGTVFDFDCDNLINNNGYTFNLNDIKKEDGFIFQDGSIQLQFSISIKKKPFKS